MHYHIIEHAWAITLKYTYNFQTYQTYGVVVPNAVGGGCRLCSYRWMLGDNVDNAQFNPPPPLNPSRKAEEEIHLKKTWKDKHILILSLMDLQ